MKHITKAFVLLVSISLSTFSHAYTFPQSEADASRFLIQATFGPSMDDIDEVMEIGYEGWLEKQFNLSGPTHLSFLQELMVDKNITNEKKAKNHHLQSAWWRASITNDDQLRQRVAFALSQILVVSTNADGLTRLKEQGLADYYDLLASHAFGNYRDLLEDVTLNPMMGRYLSMYRNQKPNPAKNIHPDENYAREVMQLFTIGLVELNDDGSPKVDANGQEIPTYTQEDIEGLAHVLTGWTDAVAVEKNRFTTRVRGTANLLRPLQAWAPKHDTNEKTIIGNTVIAAGQTAEAELEIALDTLFNHPNVPPFIGKLLIQRLVTSNPTPDYVNRISQVFKDNGEGVRGDLKAVVKAILLDPEARDGHLVYPDTFGKLKEPVLRISGLWRAFDAYTPGKHFHYGNAKANLGQAALSADTVFNFFPTDHQRSGDLGDMGLVTPEFAVLTDNNMVSTSNRIRSIIHRNNFRNVKDKHIALDLTDEVALAEDVPALVERINLLLMAGSMSDAMKLEIINHVENIRVRKTRHKVNRVADAIFMVMSSAEQAIQQ